MTFKLEPILIGGKEVQPIIEGGKGIGVSNGITAGAFAATNSIGTFSGVNADYYDEHGKLVPVHYYGKTRRERHEELIECGIKGGIAQARIAKDIAGKNGRINMNVLWEMGGAERILEGILSNTKGLIDGVTCGAGMPYRLAEIAAKHQIGYLPIISSMRAFRALWKRSYYKVQDYLNAVVYEDPWLAGGHNGLSNNEDPTIPQDPYLRVVELRTFMNEVGLKNIPIIMAGGVWHLKDWHNWLNNPEIGMIAFQYGTRPIVTVENPVSNDWKQKLLTLKEGDVYLNRFSPTGFYSSAVNNNFINELKQRNQRQINYTTKPTANLTQSFKFGVRNREVFIDPNDQDRINDWLESGFTELIKTPDSTIIFVSKDKADEIIQDQINCMGCLSFCRFSNWTDHGSYNNGKKADPRSFCIQKSLQEIIHEGNINDQLMFAGHNAYMFAKDPFYTNGFIPTTAQLIEQIKTGN